MKKIIIFIAICYLSVALKNCKSVLIVATSQLHMQDIETIVNCVILGTGFKTNQSR